MTDIQRITVYTGSSIGTEQSYRDAAAELGARLGRDGVGLVYGGGHIGLMGVVSDAALDAGASVVGVIPQALVDAELAHPRLSDLEIVPDMHTRKMRMSDLADAFVAMPGGPGTLEEFFEVWTWLQLGFHRKPVALLDVDGFWQPLIGMLDRMVETGFMQGSFRSSLIVASTVDELFDALAAWVPPAPKFAR